MMTAKIKTPAIDTAFAEATDPRCIYNSESDTYTINEAAYTQILRVYDLISVIGAISPQSDKRMEQLYNTLIFAGDLLEKAVTPDNYKD